MNKKGIAEIGMYLYGFLILFCYILILFLLSFFGTSFQEKLDAQSSLDNNINLASYLGSEAEYSEVNISMMGLILHGYYSGDEKTKEIFNPLYPRRGCLTWKIEINLKPDGEELHVIQNSKLGKEKNPGVILIKVPDENKEIEVRMVDRC